VWTKKVSGPSWCRFGVGITYRLGGKTGKLTTTPIYTSASGFQLQGNGLMCSTTHEIQRPGNGWYVVHLHAPSGTVGC
jgi:hypothetical protein